MCYILILKQLLKHIGVQVGYEWIVYVNACLYKRNSLRGICYK